MRQTTIKAHEIEKLGIKVRRARLNPYDHSEIILTVLSNTKTLPGEIQRKTPYNFSGKSLFSLAWVYFKV